MFLRTVGKPSSLKKATYLLVSTILGVLLSFIAHAFIEIVYLRWAQSQKLAVTFYNGCALWPLLQIGLWALGAVGGFFLGRFWWRIIYIERFWDKKRSTH